MRVRSGWWTFAGVMILISGVVNTFDAIVAITHTRYIERNIGGELPITNNVKNWGWAELIIGVIMILAAFGIFSGANWARIVGIVLAGINLVFQFAYLGHYPFWSFTMIVMDLLVIYGLAGASETELEDVDRL
jgi:hypothetical protein